MSSPWEPNVRSVQNSDANPLQRRSPGLPRKGRGQSKEFYPADQSEEGGTRGSDT